MKKTNSPFEVEYPEDVRLIRERIHRMAFYPDFVVAHLYKKYSESMCAGWLGGPDLKGFSDWLEYWGTYDSEAPKSVVINNSCDRPKETLDKGLLEWRKQTNEQLELMMKEATSSDGDEDKE